jgi:LacI family transcriptional regulator
VRPLAEPTLADVARAAGVSIATASRVLSGARHVSDERSRAVRKASATLGYRHNAVASALRSQRTETIGLILPRYSTGFLSALIESVSAALDEAGLSLVLRYSSDGVGVSGSGFGSGAGAGVSGSDGGSVESLLARRVDGIIVCPPSEEVSRETLAAAGSVPVVQVGRHLFGDATDSVGLDDNRATDLLVGSLGESGARSLVSVGLSNAVPADARRIAALRASCATHGLRLVDAVEADAVLAGGVAAANRLVGASVGAGPAVLSGLSASSGSSVSSGSSPAGALTWAGQRVDAIVCANDDVAHGLVTVLRLNGFDVPGTVQVASLLDVSFDDGPDRQITTLRHPWAAMGREAVRLLLDELAADPAEERPGPRRVTLAPKRLVGASTR